MLSLQLQLQSQQSCSKSAAE